jgi:hypothetical protein
VLSEIGRIVRYRMRALVDRGGLERELDEELQFHIECEAERHERSGLSREDALCRAHTEFGRLDRVKEASRRARGIESLLHDLRAAARRHTPNGGTMEKPDSLLENPRMAGVACAIAATGLGLAYMAAAGAPPLYLAVNVLALLMGLAFFGLLRPAAGQARHLPPAVTLAFGAVLLATALFGSSVEGASRWLRVGGLSLQMSLILLPAMMVAFARRRDVLSTLGLILAAVALALQPDRAMAGVLASSLAVLALRRPDNGVLAALGVAAAGFVVTLLRADTLPAVPYVDQILYTAFGVHPLAGLAVVGGSLLLAAPAIAGRKLDARTGDACAVFGIAWLGMVLAAALGNYPTPIVGYGGSAVLGYVLSLAFLPGKAHSTAPVAARAPGEEPAGEGTGFDLRIAMA